ncbi:hypothetical protein [Mesorhizobium sp. INR15]|uniref:hypothetical protein n=1 Tax=Mesorhizobium sp. INR15 TaxID=2654248 RepID=UPI0018967AD6|nr:hypothetical protein [Mesorhizobium sp. INR15]QPC92973.1 hypothetical protein GA829_21650 [Mesorhizobium sp. INR15]
MISAEDFSEVFPSMVERPRPKLEENEQAYSACIARWEDDGGQIPMRQSAGPFTQTRCVVEALTVFWTTAAMLSITNRKHRDGSPR